MLPQPAPRTLPADNSPAYYQPVPQGRWTRRFCHGPPNVSLNVPGPFSVLFEIRQDGLSALQVAVADEDADHAGGFGSQGAGEAAGGLGVTREAGGSY